MSTPSAPGWYDDPQDAAQLRYFDGVVWTSHTTPRSTRPVGSATAQPDATQLPAGAQQPSGQTPTGQAPTGRAGQAGQQEPYQQPQWQPTQQQQWQSPQQWQTPQQPNPQFPGAPTQGQWNAPTYGGYPAGPTTPDGQPLAGYWQRVGAYILDAIISGIATAILAGWLLYRAMQPFFDGFVDAVGSGDSAAVDRLTSDIDYGYLFGFSVVASVIVLAYQVFFLTRTGATPGKAAMGISVRLRERPGPLALGPAVRRSSVQALLGLVGNIPLIGIFGTIGALLDLLWPAWDDKRQALHDKFATTNVVVGRQPRG
jgi:uncharacterized RDD family membrane protein YckC